MNECGCVFATKCIGDQKTISGTGLAFHLGWSRLFTISCSIYTRLVGPWASGDFVSASHLKEGALTLATCAPLYLALCGFNASRFLHKRFTHLDITPGHEWKTMNDAQHHRAERLTSVILLLERQRQEDCYKPENSMGYKVIPWLENNNKTKQQWQNKA